MKRKMISTLLFISILIVVAACTVLSQPQFGKNPSGDRLEIIKHSPNYSDGAFQNIIPTPQSINFREAIKELLFNNSRNTKPPVEIPTVKTDLKTLNPDKNAFVWFGHSSYLLQVEGNTFLIDPVLNNYASPVSFMNRAFKGTNIYSAEDFPQIDYLIITHDHYDHLDYKSVIALKQKIDTIICPLGVGEHFEHWGFDKSKIIEKDWNQTISIANQSMLHTVTARHFSGRGLKRNQTLWASYVLQTPDLKIFIGCDGGYGSHFLEIAKKFGTFDIAFLENGQYNRLWSKIHTFPEETILIAQELQAKKIMPIHSGKFSISSHEWDEPLKKITGLNDSLNIITPKIGEVVFINDTTQQFTRWWEFSVKN